MRLGALALAVALIVVACGDEGLKSGVTEPEDAQLVANALQRYLADYELGSEALDRCGEEFEPEQPGYERCYRTNVETAYASGERALVRQFRLLMPEVGQRCRKALRIAVRTPKFEFLIFPPGRYTTAVEVCRREADGEVG